MEVIILVVPQERIFKRGFRVRIFEWVAPLVQRARRLRHHEPELGEALHMAEYSFNRRCLKGTPDPPVVVGRAGALKMSTSVQALQAREKAGA